MHLWPTVKIRDSFKQAYLGKLEWNLERIKRSKQRTSSACDQPLLADSKSQSEEEGPGHPASKLLTKLLAFAADLLLILTCCCCCRRAECDDREEN